MRTCPLLLAVFSLTCGSPRPPETGQTTTCEVDRVSDGDSFYCVGGKRVRLTGIDTPELDQGELGRESREALRRLMPEGSTVRLETDVRESDRYGRILAYAWRDSLMVNQAMLRGGWAMLYTVPPNVRYVEMFRAAEDSARQERLGHWSDNGFACTPERHRRKEC